MVYKGSTKEQIIQSAVLLFSRYGFDVVTMKQIAAEIGLTNAAIYLYFSNKEQLWDGIVEYIDRQHQIYLPARKEIETLLKTQSVEQILMKYACRPFRDNRLQTIYRLMYMHLFHHDLIRRTGRKHLLEEPLRLRRQLLEDLETLGAIPPGDFETISSLWTGTIFVLQMLALDHRKLYHPEILNMHGFFIQLVMEGTGSIPVALPVIEATAKEAMYQGEPQIEQHTKNVIAQCAYRLFSEQGYSKTTMRQIAKQAHLHVGGIYNHFENKEELLHYIFGFIQRIYRMRYQKAIDSLSSLWTGSDLQRVVASLATAIPSTSEQGVATAYRLCFREQFYHRGTQRLFSDFIVGDRDSAARAFEELVLAGKIPPCATKAVASAYVFGLCAANVGILLADCEIDLDSYRVNLSSVLVSLLVCGKQKRDWSEREKGPMVPH